MSGVAVLQYVLSSDPRVVALVAADRIFGGGIPQGVQLPAIDLQQISDVERLTASLAEAKKLVTERVQVTIHAPDYDSQKAILAAVRLAGAHRNGMTNSVDVVSIQHAGTGPDGFEPAPLDYQQTIDFFVLWRRSASA